MRVLHVLPSISPHRGGPTQVVLNLARNLRDLGVETEIATTNDNGASADSRLEVPYGQRVEYEGVPVWFFPESSDLLKRLPLTKDRAFIFSVELTRWLWQHLRDYDMVETHYLFSYASSCAGVIARWQNVPYTVRTMGQLSPWALAQSRTKKKLYTWLLERHNLNNAAAIHCTSPGEAADVGNFGIHRPTITLPLGVTPAPVIPDAQAKLHQAYGVAAETPIILFLSRLHYKKRPDLLLQSLGQLAAQGAPFHLILAGSGDEAYIHGLKDLIAALGLQSRVSVPGLVTGTDKDLLLQGSDFFVLPSFSENFGIAVAEAMSAGLPVIITPDIQISPDVSRAEAGLVVPGALEPLTAAIAQLLKFPELRQQMGDRGQQFAATHYCWRTIAQQLADVYKDLVQTHPAKKGRGN